ncbi:MAG TPA: PQQ-binding-like beta-propeller repeat protein [Planctomycetota bacterium]|nr:PQQ-binding-like beta-propeller repeat protein [Planctomycetota bacterium]
MREKKRSFLGLGVSLAVLLALAAARAEDWPTHLHDNQRSGIASEALSLPLQEAWAHTPRQAPRPAWPAPAKVDYWHKLTDLAARVTYDRAFHVVAAGDAIYFGSSAEDKVVCLDAATGRVRWTFFTGGPVRLAPTVADANVYVGSDDGWVYCLAASSGAEVWRHRAAPDARQLIGNGRLISASPVRTGILVADGTAYAGAGLFPWEGVSLVAVDARDGSPRWKPRPVNLSPQGYLLASATHLYVPTGRTAPAVFRLADGEPAGSIKGTGGTNAALAGNLFLNGPGKIGQIEAFDAATGSQLVSFNARRALATDKALYFLTGRELQALDRVRYFGLLDQSRKLAARQKAIGDALKKLGRKADSDKGRKLKAEHETNKAALAELAKGMQACLIWKRPCTHSASLILAGDTLFVGGEGDVAAFRAADGEALWSGKVEGTAYGLAAAHGRLLVSTDKGAIHCFAATGTARSGQESPSDGPPPAPPYEQAARDIVEKSGVRKGFGVVLGCGDGRLVYELAKLTELSIIGIEDDAGKRAAARRALDAAGLLGVRATVQSGPLSSLPSGFADLVVFDHVTNPRSAAPDGASRLAKPYGGALRLDGPAKLTRRGPLEGAGEWTHLYADPANTACSGDRLVGGEMRVQWFGPPGPNAMADRHHRAVPPLAKDGRLFVPAYNKIIAVDAHNGTALWEADLPESSRLGAPKDSGYLALADDLLYAVGPDECVALDVATGSIVRRFAAPRREAGGQHSWGYVATVGDALFGSGRKKGASLRAMGRTVIEIQYGDFKDVSTSDTLFCLDRKTGEKRWTYDAGVILDPTIAIADGRVYFVESANPDATKDADGRMKLDFLLGSGASLVALDARSGQTLWKKPVDLRSFQHVIFLSIAQGTVVATGSKNKNNTVWYELFAFDAKTGEPRWHREQDNRHKPGGDHGEQTRHPVIVGGIVYAEPCAYDLRTGEPVPDWKFNRGGHGCGTMSASAGQLFYRAGNPAMFDLRTRQASKLSTVSRPGCWINIIPAGGLVLVPEASSGCTCPFPVQTSFAFAPSGQR